MVSRRTFFKFAAAVLASPALAKIPVIGEYAVRGAAHFDSLCQTTLDAYANQFQDILLSEQKLLSFFREKGML